VVPTGAVAAGAAVVTGAADGTGRVLPGGAVTAAAVVVGAAVVATVEDDVAGEAPPAPPHAASTTVSAARPVPTRRALRRECWWAVNDLFWFVVSVLIIGGLLWVARRIEPHWSNKTGDRFTCRVQVIDHMARAEGRWRDARATVVDDRVSITKKVLPGPGMDGVPREVIGRSASASRGVVVFVLDGEPYVVVRVPKSSPAVARLDAISTMS
jgi:hypothetical protein